MFIVFMMIAYRYVWHQQDNDDDKNPMYFISNLLRTIPIIDGVKVNCEDGIRNYKGPWSMLKHKHSRNKHSDFRSRSQTRMHKGISISIIETF